MLNLEDLLGHPTTICTSIPCDDFVRLLNIKLVDYHGLEELTNLLIALDKFRIPGAPIKLHIEGNKLHFNPFTVMHYIEVASGYINDLPKNGLYYEDLPVVLTRHQQTIEVVISESSTKVSEEEGDVDTN